ncbi:hypothetical protein C8Q80DRAFT_1265621 [Daedaleopsis nitida]|nr:hypothetical protein C8Q80DRAFT_1265621 [Daedaleopsis nitida]
MSNLSKGGATMYFGLYTQSEQETLGKKSWMAFDNFPSHERHKYPCAFSRPILIHYHEYYNTQFGTQWLIKLHCMEFMEIDPKAKQLTKKGKVEFQPEEGYFMVDTGACSTDMPARIIDELRMKIFKNQLTSDARRLRTKSLDKAPSGVDINNWTIGEEKEWMSQDKTMPVNVLGINFFQAMFVGMHLPSPGVPYITLAGRDWGSRLLHQLPPSRD